MAAQDLWLKAVWDNIRRTSPELVYLYASYFRRNARKFRAISEGPTLFHRATFAAALGSVCILASYAAVLMDPAKDFPGLMSAEKRAVWAALVPVLAALPMYWLLRRYSKEPIFFTFLNLGFVTSTAVMVIPTIIGLAGFHASSMDTDFANLRAGRADGTALHEVFCGSLEKQAIHLSLLYQQERMAPQLEQAHARMLAGRQEVEASRRETDAMIQRLQMAGGPSPANKALMDEYMAGMQQRLEVTRRELARTKETTRLLVANIDLIERSTAMVEEQVFTPWRFAKAYPVATLFLAIAWIVGVLLWLFAAVICWALVVKVQQTKWRRRLVGSVVVALFATTMVSFGALRSGVLESFAKEEQSLAALQGQLQARFQLMGSMCPRLDNQGLW